MEAPRQSRGHGEKCIHGAGTGFSPEPADSRPALDTPAGAPDACILITCGAEKEVERPVLRMGHPELRRVAEPVPELDIGTARIESLVEDLWDTMAARGGVGLAATQNRRAAPRGGVRNGVERTLPPTRPPFRAPS